MTKKILFPAILCCFTLTILAQTPQPVKRLLKMPYMKGASFSLVIQEVGSDKAKYAVSADLSVIPASVMKTVTTATALELLGNDYRFATSLTYDGHIKDGVLHGNLYIEGSGDPTLGSRFVKDNNTEFLNDWLQGIKAAGIRSIEGSVIADERCFDTEGVSIKWVGEDLGSYFGAGSYGLSVFDNQYKVFVQTGAVGTKPVIKHSEPDMSGLRFHNYLVAGAVATDSSYTLGAPFAADRYLYGVVPANRPLYTMKGDIPDPPYFLADYFSRFLKGKGIQVGGQPSCFRLLDESQQYTSAKRVNLVTTYSPPVSEIVRITNEVSQNLYADALLKTIGHSYTPEAGEVISSFGKGIKRVKQFWDAKGIDTYPLWMFDGSGLSSSDKLSARFLADILLYMATDASSSQTFYNSLPRTGIEGSVRNFMKGYSLEGNIRLKSGSMSRVKGYAGYVDKDGKRYCVTLFVNNYSCDGKIMTYELDRLLRNLFE